MEGQLAGDPAIPNHLLIRTFGPVGSLAPPVVLRWDDLGHAIYIIELVQPESKSCRKPSGATTFGQLTTVYDLVVRRSGGEPRFNFSTSGGECTWTLTGIGGIPTTKPDSAGNCQPAQFLYHWAVRAYSGERSAWSRFTIDGSL